MEKEKQARVLGATSKEVMLGMRPRSVLNESENRQESRHKSHCKSKIDTCRNIETEARPALNSQRDP